MHTPHLAAAHLAAAAFLLCLASPALAQLRNHSVSVESVLSAPLSARAAVRGGVALSATRWLDGPTEAVVRVGLSSAPETGGRPPATAVTGTVGVRVSLLPDPLRPQLGLELGWARMDKGAPRDRMAFGVDAGLEWFPGRDVSVAARGALRSVGSVLSLDALLALAAYF